MLIFALLDVVVRIWGNNDMLFDHNFSSRVLRQLLITTFHQGFYGSFWSQLFIKELQPTWFKSSRKQHWVTSWENLHMPYANSKGANQPAHSRSLSEQRLCCSLPWCYNISSFYIFNFMTLACFCSWAGWFESHLVKNVKDRFSRDVTHLETYMMLLCSLHNQLSISLIWLKYIWKGCESPNRSSVHHLNTCPYFYRTDNATLYSSCY